MRGTKAILVIAWRQKTSSCLTKKAKDGELLSEVPEDVADKVKQSQEAYKKGKGYVPPPTFEEFKNAKKSFNIPGLGKFYPSESIFLKINKLNKDGEKI